MPNIYVDQSQVTFEHVSSVDTGNTNINVEGVVIPVLIPDSDITDWLAAYDSTNQYSPSATDSRKIARKVLDALKKYNE